MYKRIQSEISAIATELESLLAPFSLNSYDILNSKYLMVKRSVCEIIE
ncbi:hypothetical protein VIBNISO65_660008 [Vibrio nigripulchritudo SO65]|nr:hypothetical protein VIBNIAM115_1430008 [Vibrio nigripulchritudo AM115]CCN43863.1 hypothetical protein VIBNIFTn2_630008 [Vibrio nigripulchritudo FTn2]CCN68169.1 hypothetical protein VIBNIPon4_960008 [Vibrio nigripulchritudo POn4]CCN78531.1 hypothetical protein VIBNISO65_660008 [Vibrio nigripulchritudo SO65]